MARLEIKIAIAATHESTLEQTGLTKTKSDLRTNPCVDHHLMPKMMYQSLKVPGHPTQQPMIGLGLRH